jgi:topoisomerase-4 subunit B
MNPMQLRETTMAPDTRRLVQLLLTAPATAGSAEAAETAEPPPGQDVDAVIDRLLAKGRAADRREWLMAMGDRAVVE